MSSKTFNNTKINVEFDEDYQSRTNINSGENISSLFAKIRRFMLDLKAVAFSGSYIDLSDRPTTATADTDGLMSAEDKVKLDGADNKYALKSKYGDTTINVGRKSNSVIGMRSTAEGISTTASGDYSHAEGSATTASGSSSHAEGSDTVASGSYSHAEGCFTTSNGADSHAEGYSSRNVISVIPDLSSDTSNSDIITVWNKSRFSLAKGLASHVENADCLALGHYSHAEGRYNIAIGDYSHVEGLYTIANNNHESTCGTYNKSNADTLFSIGDGTSDSARHNAFEITTTGGKLHDKDIATTDIIPDLSAYAKTADVPNIKVNEAVNADTVGGISPDEISTTPIKSTTGTYSIDEWGGVTLWFVGQIGTPIFAYSNGYYAPITPSIGGTDMSVWRLIFSQSAVFGTSREITIVYY